MKTKTAKIWLREDGIIHLKATAEFGSLECAKENVAALITVSQGKKRPAILNISSAKSLSREERAYYSSEESAKALSAAGLIINSPITRVLGNFFVGLNKTPYPLQLFTNEEKAIPWLKGFIE